MLLTEPILFSLSLYMAFVYGILYLDFTAYPFVFEDTRQWTAGIAGLSFLGTLSHAYPKIRTNNIRRHWCGDGYSNCLFPTD